MSVEISDWRMANCESKIVFFTIHCFTGEA